MFAKCKQIDNFLKIVHLIIASTLQYYVSLKLGSIILDASHWMKNKKYE